MLLQRSSKPPLHGSSQGAQLSCLQPPSLDAAALLLPAELHRLVPGLLLPLELMDQVVCRSGQGGLGQLRHRDTSSAGTYVVFRYFYLLKYFYTPRNETLDLLYPVLLPGSTQQS